MTTGHPGGINAHLRRLWAAVAIAPDMSVAGVELIVPDFMHDEAAYAEREVAADRR